MLANSGVCFFAVADVKLWYRFQRTILGKVYKNKSGQKRCQLTARSGCTKIWVFSSSTWCTVHRGPSLVDCLMEKMTASLSPQSPRHLPEKSRKKDVDTALLEFLQKTENQTVDLATKMDSAMDQGSSEKQAWVDWMLQALRPLPHHIWREVTKEAFALLQKYQENAENEQATQQFATKHMQQHVRQITPLMPMPPRMPHPLPNGRRTSPTHTPRRTPKCILLRSGQVLGKIDMPAQVRWPRGIELHLLSCRLGFDSDSGQTNDLKIGIHSFPA